VLFPSAEASARGRKVTHYHYRTLTTLQEYGLIDSERISVECYRRGKGRLWLYTLYTAGDEIVLESISLTCAIELLYEDAQLAK
jgi:Uma2 family endonuclease